MKYPNLSLPAVLHLSEINPPRSNKEKEEKENNLRVTAKGKKIT